MSQNPQEAFESRQQREWEIQKLSKQINTWERRKRRELIEHEQREKANPLWGKFT